MKSTELRIGNLIKTYTGENDGFDIVKIYSLDEDSVNGFKRYLRDAEPVPLTTEFLLKNGVDIRKCGICGQDQWAGMDFYTWNGITFRGNARKGIVFLYLYPIGTMIDSVHKFQNLCYELKNEELGVRKPF